MSEPNQIDAPKTWLEFWQAPLRYRATYDRGKFGPGHSLAKISEYGQSGTNHEPIFRVHLDPDDAAIVIEWLVGLPGTKPPFQAERYFGEGPGRGFYDRLRTDGALRHLKFSHIPAGLRERAIGAYAIAVSIREWVFREFLNSVHAGQCEIWARVGGRVAPFSRVPIDAFRAYRITSWGNGVPGGATAELEGEPKLYAIHVAPIVEPQIAEGSVAISDLGLPPPKRRGRRLGSGSMKAADAPLLEEMHRLLADHKAFSPEGAAKLVAMLAAGTATESSKATRLAKRYREKFMNSENN